MKKLLLAIITLTIITLNGCYDPDTATVRINLGNMPIAHHEPKSFIDKVLGLFEKDAWASDVSDERVDVIHVAAYSGNSVIATMSIDALDAPSVGNIDVVEFEVPAGEDITIVVLGEEIDTVASGIDYISYHGSETTSLVAGEIKEIDVTVSAISNKIAFSTDTESTPALIYWSAIECCSGYLLEYAEDGTNYITLYQGSNTEHEIVNTGEGSFRLTVLFDNINLKSDTFIEYF